MTSRDWFALAIRVFGATQLISGLVSLLDALLFWLGYFHLLDTSPRYYVVTGLFLVVIGIYFLRGAAAVVAFAYPCGDYPEAIEDDEGGEKMRARKLNISRNSFLRDWKLQLREAELLA